MTLFDDFGWFGIYVLCVAGFMLSLARLLTLAGTIVILYTKKRDE